MPNYSKQTTSSATIGNNLLNFAGKNFKTPLVFSGEVRNFIENFSVWGQNNQIFFSSFVRDFLSKVILVCAELFQYIFVLKI